MRFHGMMKDMTVSMVSILMMLIGQRDVAVKYTQSDLVNQEKAIISIISSLTLAIFVGWRKCWSH
jgi:hypothetical protein